MIVRKTRNKLSDVVEISTLLTAYKFSVYSSEDPSRYANHRLKKLGDCILHYMVRDRGTLHDKFKSRKRTVPSCLEGGSIVRLRGWVKRS